MMVEDIDLLKEYAQHNSERAFAELVSRHINLVYSVAFLDYEWLMQNTTVPKTDGWP